MPHLRLLAIVLTLSAACWLLAAPAGLHAEDEAPRSDVLDLINPRPGERIADVGCGRGTWTLPLARAVGPEGQVLAVDIDADVLETVRARVAKADLQNVRVIHSVPDDPMLPAGAVDAIFLNDVIDYVKRDVLVGFLAGIRKALTAEGRLIIRDPNGHPDRVIAECYRAGFALVEAKVPLPITPSGTFAGGWYALKLRRGERQHAILPRLGHPRQHRTRLHVAEELFRHGLIGRAELRSAWERIAARDAGDDAARDEAEALLRAARALEVLPPERLDAVAQELANR